MNVASLVMNHFETKEFCNVKRRKLTADETNEIARILGCRILLAEYLKDNFALFGYESAETALYGLYSDLNTSVSSLNFEKSAHSVLGAFVSAQEIEEKIAEKAALKIKEVGDLSLAIDFDSVKTTLYFILELSVLNTADHDNRLWPLLHRFFKCSSCETIHEYPHNQTIKF